MKNLRQFENQVDFDSGSYISIATGILAATTLIVLAFSDLFTTGRIWAEEGAKFMAHILDTKSTHSISQALYLHNGHWDLWTNLAAYLASLSLLKSPLIFTWMSVIPHMITAMRMGLYALPGRALVSKYSFIIGAMIGFLALLANTFTGGVEVFITTTNTQWILSVYIFFSICSNILTDSRRSARFVQVFTFILDLLVMLSSFAGSILFPIQIICFATIGFSSKESASRTINNVIVYSKRNSAFFLGFLIQAVTTLIFSVDSTKGRSLDILVATKGFFIQGVAGLIIPPQGSLEGLANTVKHNGFFIDAFCLTMFVFIMTVFLYITRGKFQHLIAIYLVTFVFCQLALGDKADLISAGGSMRYFATARICMIWILVTEITKSQTLKAHAKILLFSMVGLICLTSAMYFESNTLKAVGILPGECQTATNKSLRIPGDESSIHGEGIPICPSGWNIQTQKN